MSMSDIDWSRIRVWICQLQWITLLSHSCFYSFSTSPLCDSHIHRYFFYSHRTIPPSHLHCPFLILPASSACPPHAAHVRHTAHPPASRLTHIHLPDRLPLAGLDL